MSTNDRVRVVEGLPVQPGGSEGSPASDIHVRNTISGPVAGNFVQAGAIHGLTIHTHESSRVPANHQDIRDALAHVTVRTAEGTGVYVAPGVVLTTTEAGLALVPGEHDERRFALLSPALDQDDELAALYHPTESAQAHTVRWIQLQPVQPEPGPAGTRALCVIRGSSSAGHVGAPVLNWRTGAVCGVLAPADPAQPDVVLLRPISVVLREFAHLVTWHGGQTWNVAWLNILDDEQLRAGGWRYPGRTLRRYLAAAAQADTTHPYAELLSHAPPLREVYLRQQARPHSDKDTELLESVSVETILREHHRVRVVGGPGAGKSSLVRHVTGSCARQWLDKGVGDYVAVAVSAEVLSDSGTLPERLATGVSRDLRRTIGPDRVAMMFSREPIPGVPWLILVDGLDEIAPWQRPWVLHTIADQRWRSSQYRFLVTTRPLGDLPGLSTEEHHPSFAIERFDETARHEFAVGWFRAIRRITEQDAATIAVTFLELVDKALPPDLTGIPLILTMLCILYDECPADDLPSNQAELYEKFVIWLGKKQRTEDLVARLGDLVHNRGPRALAAVGRLGQHLNELLEWVAYHRQQLTMDRFHAQTSLLEDAAAWPVCRPGGQLLPADEWTNVVTEALRACGLVMEHGGEFVFLHQTMQEYLAARHINRTRGRRWFAARSEFAPRSEWPWPDLQVKLFLAAMWPGRMRRPLRRLLTRRHRTSNVGFVVQLTRYGLRLDLDIRSMAITTLRSLIHDPAPGMIDWQQYVEWLRQLDKSKAATTLRDVLDAPDAPETRLFEALRQLAELDRADAFARMAMFVRRPNHSGEACLRMARLAAGIDIDHGVALFVVLVGRPELGHLRLEAAQWVMQRDVVRGTELFATIRDDPHAQDALRVTAAIVHARREPRTGIPGLVTLGRDGSLDQATRFRLAHDVLDIDRTAAADIYTALVRDPGIPAPERIHGIHELVAEFGRPAWLVDVAHDPAEDAHVRTAAAWAVASHDASAGLVLLREIVDNDQAGDLPRTTAAQLIDILWRHAVAPVALDGLGVADVDRLEVASDVLRIAGPPYALPLFTAVAENSDTPPAARVAAATAAADIDDAVARPLFTALALDPNIPDILRLDAATTAAERYGSAEAEPLLLSLARNAVVFAVRMQSIDHLRYPLRADLYVALSETPGLKAHNRLAAAKAAASVDKDKGTQALVTFVERSAGGFALCMDAIRHIANHQQQIRLYGSLADSPLYSDGDRLTAAKAAANLGSTRPLQQLSTNPNVTQAVRNAAQQKLAPRTGKKK